MDSESFDQMPIPLERVGDAKNYLKENLEVDVLLYKGNAINIELPAFIEAVITQDRAGHQGRHRLGLDQARHDRDRARWCRCRCS